MHDLSCVVHLHSVHSDGTGTVELIAAAGFDRFSHARHRMLAQQLQDLHEPARAGHRAVESLQFSTKKNSI